MQLDLDAARAGIDKAIAQPLGLDVATAARAIVDIGVAKMSLAVRQVSVEKGYDPRDFSLVASGGAGPLHAVAIARDLRIPKVIVPWFPSHFSAMGMLMADERHDSVRTYPAPLDDVSFSDLAAVIAELEGGLHKVSRNDPTIAILLDLRYIGQEFSLSVPVTRAQIAQGDRVAIRAAFDALHQQRYAHSADDEPVEMINVRLVATARRPKPVMPTPSAATPQPRTRMVTLDAGGPVACALYDRPTLAAGTRIDGPALIQEYGTTTVVFPQDRCEIAASGELVVTVAS
jgi:N-methylhydantoinase A